MNSNTLICKYFHVIYSYPILTLTLFLFKWFEDWFEAGKGPDPTKAALDRNKQALDKDMDEYFKAKNTAAVAATSGTVGGAVGVAPSI